MTEDRRKPGRPRVEEPRTTVTTYIRTADYDRLLRLALKQEQSLSGLVRDLLKLKIR